MRQKVAIIYNQPGAGRYLSMGEAEAEAGVLEEVQTVQQALDGLGYSVVPVPLSPPLESAKVVLKKLKVDVVFNLFEGFSEDPHTEAVLAYLLEEMGLPFTGCPSKALSLALDKVQAKAILESGGISTPRYQLLSPTELPKFNLNFPCIVKPRAEDASHGLSEESLVNNYTALERQVSAVSRLFGGTALVEEFISGREFNATVLGSDKPVVLPISEIVYSLPLDLPRILTYAAKWEPDTVYYKGTEPVCPAELDNQDEKRITETALTAFKLLGCRGYARVDMRTGDDKKVYVLEVNPNPDISPTSGTTHQVKAAGMSYNDFVERVVQLALNK